MTEQLEKILARVHGLAGELEPFREMLLANVVMISEIPAPTFGEEERISFLNQRFTESGLDSTSIDELGNGVAILPGSDGKRTILLTAHADTPFSASENHSCTLDTGRILGSGVADNSLGLAVLATLPTILEGLDIQLKNDLIFLCSTCSLEQGNQRGLRFFLSNTNRSITAGLAIEGASIGRLHYRSMASLGGMISCHVSRKVSQKSAIEVLNQVINRLVRIELPEETHTGLVLGEISGGASYKIPARNAQLLFQLRSDDDETVADLRRQINVILDDEAREKGVSCHLEGIARTRAGGLESDHPLVFLTRRVMTELGIRSRESVYSAIMSAYGEHEIPAVCIGITEGDNINYPDEYVEIEPILTGVAQLIGVLMAIDGGCCA
jgi:acetylornithine deacetylase/succinyl-diaminopimelate desuccinylase-like protein